MSNENAWGGGFSNSHNPSPPKIAPDEDFGGWNSAAPETPAVVQPSPGQSMGGAKTTGGGFGGGSEDLFSNVWE